MVAPFDDLRHGVCDPFRSGDFSLRVRAGRLIAVPEKMFEPELFDAVFGFQRARALRGG
jgi:hypothetical protein